VVNLDWTEEVPIDVVSLNNLSKDFGEVLDALLILASVKNLGKGLIFPEDANEPLIDILCDDGYKVSAKEGKGGAKASIVSIIKILEANQNLPNDKKIGFDGAEQEIVDILLSIQNLSVYEQFMKLADTLSQSTKTISYRDDTFEPWDMLAYKHLLKEMGGRATHPTQKELEDYLEALSDEAYYLLAEEILSLASRNLKEKIESFTGKARLGPIFVAITNDVGNALTVYETAFSAVITKVLSLKQIYMTVSIKANKITFQIKASETMTAQFVTSKPLPTQIANGGLAFQFIKSSGGRGRVIIE
jgi:hypothetical protein